VSPYDPSLSDVDSGVTEGAWKISGGSELKFTLLVFFLIVEGSDRGTVKILPSIPLANVIVLELSWNGFGETTGLLTCEMSNWRTGFGRDGDTIANESSLSELPTLSIELLIFNFLCTCSSSDSSSKETSARFFKKVPFATLLH